MPNDLWIWDLNNNKSMLSSSTNSKYVEKQRQLSINKKVEQELEYKTWREIVIEQIMILKSNGYLKEFDIKAVRSALESS